MATLKQITEYMAFCGDIIVWEAHEIIDIVKENGGSISHEYADKLLSPWGGWDPDFQQEQMS